MTPPRFLAIHPLVPVALLFVAGLALGRWFDPPAILCLILLALALAASLVTARRSPVAAQWALGGALVFAGCGIYQLDQRYGSATDMARFVTSTQPRLVTCRITTITAPDNAVVHMTDAPSVGIFLAQVDALKTSMGWIPAAGTVQVKVPRGARVRQGQRLELMALAARPAGPKNPGEFDNATYLRASGIFTVLQVKLADQIKPVDAGGIRPAGLLQRFRLTMREKLLGSVEGDDPDSGHTMVALLLGHRDSSISDVSRAFVACGAAHLLAISGFHIVLIAGVAWFILRWIIPRPRWRSVAVAFLVGLYIAATPCGPPVLRAGLVLLLVLSALFMGRRPMNLNLLAAALLIILFFRPADFLDAGLQISFIVTAGLITLVPGVNQLLLGRYLARRAGIARAIGTSTALFKIKILRVYCELAIANGVGALLSMPLVAFHFHQINPLAFITWMLILPLVLIGILLALVQLLASLLGTWMGAMAAVLSVRWTAWMVWVLKHIAAWPLATVALRPPPWYLVALLYAAVVLWLIRPKLQLSRATALVLGCVPLPLMAAWYMSTAPMTGLHLWQLSVPGGACVAGQTEDGHTFLINVGARNGQFVARTLEPFLRIQGISHIDMALFTNFDTAHAGALLDLAQYHRPAHVFGPGGDPGRFAFADDLPRGLPLEAVSAGTHIMIGARTAIEVLWPPPKMIHDRPYAQMPLILRITIGGKGEQSVLIVGRQNRMLPCTRPCRKSCRWMWHSLPGPELRPQRCIKRW